MEAINATPRRASNHAPASIAARCGRQGPRVCVCVFVCVRARRVHAHVRRCRARMAVMGRRTGSKTRPPRQCYDTPRDMTRLEI